MRNPSEAGLRHVPHRAKGLLVEYVFGAAIHQSPLLATEWYRIAFVLDQVLTDLGADSLQDEPDMSDDRIVAKDGVLRLQ